MNIQLKFLEKAIQDKNYISFTYENKSFKKVKILKLKKQDTKNILITENESFDFSLVKKLTILKDKF